MRIASFNINGIRAAQRRGFDAWLAGRGCDVVALQEVRCPIAAVPEGAFGEMYAAYDPGLGGSNEQTPARGLLGFFLFARWLVASKFGRVLQAIRDAESRVMFSGYNPIGYHVGASLRAHGFRSTSPRVPIARPNRPGHHRATHATVPR